MTSVRILALGNAFASDDGAALVAAEQLRDSGEVIAAGRPGVGLLDLLDPERPTLVMDVVRRGARAGALVRLELDALTDASIDGKPVSSHGLGVAQTLRLARSLGRSLPSGVFFGIGGVCFDPGDALSPEVAAGVDHLVREARAWISSASRKDTACTNTD